MALTGDVGAKNVFELRSPELIVLIGEMNVGKFEENDLKAPTNLQIGAAVNPNVGGQVERLKEKIAAGVQFIQTRPIFSRAKFDQFLTELKKINS